MSDKTKIYLYNGEAQLDGINVQVVAIGSGALVTVFVESDSEEDTRDTLFARTEFFASFDTILDALPGFVNDVIALFEGLVQAQGGKFVRPAVEVGD